MTTLAVVTVHERPDILYEQLRNFNHCFNNNIFHIVHVNTEFYDQFWQSAKVDKIDFSIFKNVYFISKVRTKWGGIFHAWILGLYEALKLNLDFSHILFHSNADLMVRLNVDRYLEAFDIGFDAPIPTSPNDFWHQQIIANPKVMKLSKDLGYPLPLRSRVDSCFFRKEVFFQLFFPLAILYDYTSDELMPSYPVEEVDLVTIVEYFCSKHPTLKRARNLVFASKSEAQACDKDIVDWAHVQDNIYGLKRFSGIKSDPVRLYVKSLIKLPPE